MADYSAEIQQLEALVNSATTSVTADGLTSQFNLDHAKSRLAELKRLQGTDLRLVKPRIATLDLGGCW